MRGTYRADRHGDASAEPQFEALKALPPCPGFFDDVAAFEWGRVGPELIAKELLCEADLATFTLYCLSVARVVACEKLIKAQGMTFTTKLGYVIQRPEVSTARQCGAEVRKFAQEFGLTPSARSRVRIKPAEAAKPTNPFAETAANE